MSPWSSGQDVALSRRNQGFDSPRRYQEKKKHESASFSLASDDGESNAKGRGRREALRWSGEQAVVRADRAGRRRTADLPLAKTRTPLGDTKK